MCLFVCFLLLISILFFPDSEDVCIFVYLSVCNFFSLSLVCICFLTFEAFVCLSQILHNLTLCVCVFSSLSGKFLCMSTSVSQNI